MSDNFIFPDSPDGLPSRDPAADLAPTGDAAEFGAPPEAGAAPGFGAADFADEGIRIGGDPFSAPEFVPSEFGADRARAARRRRRRHVRRRRGPGRRRVVRPQTLRRRPTTRRPRSLRGERSARRSKEGLMLGVHVTPKQRLRRAWCARRPTATSRSASSSASGPRAEHDRLAHAALSPDEIGVHGRRPSSRWRARRRASSLVAAARSTSRPSSPASATSVGTRTAGNAPASVSAVAQPIIFELQATSWRSAPGRLRPPLAGLRRRTPPTSPTPR